MPTYEYKCKKCGKEFEIMQRITESALTQCPEPGCNGEIFRKISKNIGLVFNGSGFYITDYANKKENPPSRNGNGHSAHSHTESSTKNGNGTAKAPAEQAAPAPAATTASN